jgi:plastocyanin
MLAMLITMLGLGVGYGTAAGSSPLPDSHPVTAVGQANTVVIRSFAYGPSSLVVSPGVKVAMVNEDCAPHTVTVRNKSFDTGALGRGQWVGLARPPSRVPNPTSAPSTRPWPAH